MCKGIYDFFKPHPFLPTFHGVREGGDRDRRICQTTSDPGQQKIPNLHSSTNCWHDIFNNNIYSPNCWLDISNNIYFQKCIFPNPTPTAPTIIPSDEYPTPTYIIYSTYIYSQNCLQHISNTNIYFEIYTYIPQPCVRRAYRNYPIKGSPPY